MARREWTLRKQCTHYGCTEFSCFRYDTQRELRESSYQSKPWTCTRHTNAEKLLTLENMVRETVVINAAGPAGKLYWMEGERMNSGFIYGAGFKAFADDFPPGTRLIITARVETPEDQEKRSEV